MGYYWHVFMFRAQRTIPSRTAESEKIFWPSTVLVRRIDVDP